MQAAQKGCFDCDIFRFKKKKIVKLIEGCNLMKLNINRGFTAKWNDCSKTLCLLRASLAYETSFRGNNKVSQFSAH